MYIHSRSEKFEIYRNDYASSVELNIENQNGTVVYANGHTSYGKSYLASKVRVFQGFLDLSRKIIHHRRVKVNLET